MKSFAPRKKKMSSDEENMIPPPHFGSFPVDVYQYLSETATGLTKSLDGVGDTVDMRRFNAQMDREAACRRMRLDHQPQLLVDLRKVKEEKGKGVAAEGVRRLEEQVIVSERGRKRPLVVLSSDSESCDTQNAEEEEVVKYDEVIEEDDGIYGTVFQWRRKISGRVVQRNVLQLPQKVIKKCLMTGHERIQIADSDTGIDYDCVLHRAVRRYGVERFIGEGWYEFAKRRDIKRGDRVGFSLRVPPASKIVVSILNR